MIRKLTYILAVFVLMLPVTVLVAAQVGETLPHDLALKDKNGEVQSFETLSGEKGVVLVFVRSADWCPYCQVQLLGLKDGGQAIEELGYKIVSVSYDAPDVLKTFADKYGFPYVMLSDVGSVAIKDFDILNETFEPDHFAYGVPHPYVYVIGKNKYIQAVLNEEGYKKRPQVEAIVETIEALN